MLQEFLLQDMQPVRLGQALDCLNSLALRFDPEHQAGAEGAPINDHGAGPAVAGEASLLAAGQFKYIAKSFKQALAWFAEEFGLLAIDSCFDYYFFCHFGAD